MSREIIFVVVLSASLGWAACTQHYASSDLALDKQPIAAQLSDAAFRFGTWNVERLGSNGDKKPGWRASETYYELVAEVIQNTLDVAVIIEAKKAEGYQGVQRALERLYPEEKWSFLASQHTAFNGEYYVVFYRASKVVPCKQGSQLPSNLVFFDGSVEQSAFEDFKRKPVIGCFASALMDGIESDAKIPALALAAFHAAADGGDGGQDPPASEFAKLGQIFRSLVDTQKLYEAYEFKAHPGISWVKGESAKFEEDAGLEVGKAAKAIGHFFERLNDVVQSL